MHVTELLGKALTDALLNRFKRFVVDRRLRNLVLSNRSIIVVVDPKCLRLSGTDIDTI
jgi:hypothetical protein